MEPKAIPKQIKAAVYDALDLLQAAQLSADQSRLKALEPLTSLLEQCGALAGADEAADAEPIRLIHHFACTGGTLITKCLACVPNVQVLSEVDPLSSLPGGGGKFSPADIIGLAKHSNHAPTRDERVELFMSSLSTLYRINQTKGLHLLIRDHAHSHFCTGGKITQRPSLQQMLADRYPVRSIVTVRHPIDSWLALLSNKWLHFEPATVDEYALRYEAFLDLYAEAPIFRYEDFIDKSDDVLYAMSEALNLDFPKGYRELFMVHAFSGDSGRKGSEIRRRPRRSLAAETRTEVEQSHALRRVCKRLGYQWDI